VRPEKARTAGTLAIPWELALGGKKEHLQKRWRLASSPKMAHKSRMPAGKSSPNPVDAYIAKVPEHFRPICRKLRELILSVGPEWEETMRWNQPAYRGKGLICLFGAFKHHVRLIFFRKLPDPDHVLAHEEESAGGHGLKIVTESDIPVAKLRRLLKEAAKVDKTPPPKSEPKPRRPELPVPSELSQALERSPKAMEIFGGLSPSCRREYIEWISSAKRPETRERRIVQALDMLEAGRRMNDKYR
jgi:uncharacterized protein YdeI (YjbR/CyaY-like superfamily)